MPHYNVTFDKTVAVYSERYYIYFIICQVSTAEGWNPLNFYLLKDAQCDEETIDNIEMFHRVPLFQAVGERSEFIIKYRIFKFRIDSS